MSESFFEKHIDKVNWTELCQNKNMSEKRAESIANYLITKKIAPNRVSHIGLGAKFPIADNATEEGRAKNRRSSFVLTLSNIK